MSDNNRIKLIKELGDMLEIILKGTESEHSSIYNNYLERIYKITKVFINNIEKELEELKEKDDDSDDENSFRKYNDNNDEVDSVSEYENYESDNDSDSDNNSNTDDNKKDRYKVALVEFDSIIKELYDNLQQQNDIVVKKID